MPKFSRLLRKCLSDDVAVDVRVDLLSVSQGGVRHSGTVF